MNTANIDMFLFWQRLTAFQNDLVYFP